MTPHPTILRTNMAKLVRPTLVHFVFEKLPGVTTIRLHSTMTGADLLPHQFGGRQMPPLRRLLPNIVR